MVGGDGGAASVFVFRPGIYDICKIDQVPDPEEILTLRTFLKGFTCNLTLSHFLGQTSQKTTLYIINYKCSDCKKSTIYSMIKIE